MVVEISVRARHVSGFEYMAEIKLGEVSIWTSLVYGTENDGKSHSEATARENALLIVGGKLQHLLYN